LRLLERPTRKPTEDGDSGLRPEPIACDSEIAVDQIAALCDGNLSPAEMDELAEHVVGCESCKLLVSFVAQDLLSVEKTGEHRPMEPR
jgi:hypothetical protein